MNETYAYTLTTSECVSALGKKMVAPSRTLSTSLLVLAGFAGIMFYLLRSLAANDPSKTAVITAGYIFSLASAVLAAILWVPEGRRSVRRRTAEFERNYRTYMTEARFSFDGEGWSLQHEGAAEDTRKFASLKICRDTPSLLILITETAHIVPKRILPATRLEELRRLCNIEDASSPGWRTRGRLDQSLAIVEYALFRQPKMLFVSLFLALIAAGLTAVRVHVGAISGLEEITVHWNRALGVFCLTVCIVAALYALVGAFAEKRLKYGSVTGTGFSVVIGEESYYFQWSYFTHASEGWFSFFFEARAVLYQAFPKRLLSSQEKEFLRQRTVEKNS